MTKLKNITLGELLLNHKDKKIAMLVPGPIVAFIEIDMDTLKSFYSLFNYITVVVDIEEKGVKIFGFFKQDIEL